MEILKFIKKLFNTPPTWQRLEYGEIPKWVVKAIRRFEHKCARKPYDVTKHFVGRTFIYRAFFKMVEQGQIETLVWRKLKHKKRKYKSKKAIRFYITPSIPSWTHNIKMGSSGPKDYYLCDDIKEIIRRYPKGTKYKIVRKGKSYLVAPIKGKRR